MKSRSLKSIETPPPAVEAASPAGLFNKGLELMQSRQFQEAIAAFQEVLKLDPQNTWASEQIEKAEKSICQEYYRTLQPGKIPYYLVPESTLTRHNLTHEEGFVASRINGTWDVKSIVMLSPLRELEILQVLDKLLKMELIALKYDLRLTITNNNRGIRLPRYVLLVSETIQRKPHAGHEVQAQGRDIRALPHISGSRNY